MKRTIISLLFLLILYQAYSQDNLQVRYDYDVVGNANFVADNYTNIPVYVALDFGYLENASFSEKLPFIKRINPGTTPLFTIYREIDMPSPDFNLEIIWFMSHPSPDVDPGFPYLIPAIPGTEVKITSEIDNKNNRALGFIMKGADDVVASRKGVVVRIVNNIPPNVQNKKEGSFNLVQLLHDDGTIGEYYNFAFKKVSCKLGQTVFSGQIIGKADQVEDNNYLIGFSLFHSELSSKNNIFLVMEYYLGASKISQLENGKTYKSVHDEKIIIKELSGKEKREYKKHLK